MTDSAAQGPPLAHFETLELGWLAPGVLELALNRPEDRNAVDRTMHHELVTAFHQVQDLPNVGAMVLTGRGRIFCAGGSMQMIQSFAEDDWRRTIRTMEQGVRLIQELLMVRPPIVAAVHGPAIGLGATLALLSDVIVMADDTFLADTHVKAGIVAGDGGTLIWPAVLGPARAKELLMTGDPVSAEQAERWGLVNHLAAKDDVHDEALRIAIRLAGGARQAIAWTKQVVNTSLLREAMTQMPLALAQEARTMGQPDVAEGTSAFLERRDPEWPSTAPEA